MFRLRLHHLGFVTIQYFILILILDLVWPYKRFMESSLDCGKSPLKCNIMGLELDKAL